MKYLFVGLGSIGKRHLKNLRQMTKEEILVYDINPNRIKGLAEEYKFKIVADFKRALAERPDAVFITNPTALHLPYAIKAARAGCHLFIEKPISHNLKNLAKLFLLARKNNLVVFVGFNFRFHPNLIRIKKLLDEKTIGKVLYARIEAGQYLPDWHPKEDYSKGYAARKELGGGVVLTMIHEIDYVYWLFGGIHSVMAEIGKISSLKLDVEDTACIILKSESNALFEIHLDYLQRPLRRTCRIVGDRGRIEWDYGRNEVKLFLRENDKPKIFKAKFERNQMYQAELKHFLDCLKDKEKPKISPAEIIEVMRLVAAVKKSSQTGKRIIVG